MSEFAHDSFNTTRSLTTLLRAAATSRSVLVLPPLNYSSVKRLISVDEDDEEDIFEMITVDGVEYQHNKEDNVVIRLDDFAQVGKWNKETEEIDRQKQINHLFDLQDSRVGEYYELLLKA